MALPYRIEQEVWRIGQEALVNVERHSGASEVTVKWDVRDGLARLEIIDDGKGFEPDEVRGEHYGLVGMRERADAIGAHLIIERAPVRGHARRGRSHGDQPDDDDPVDLCTSGPRRAPDRVTTKGSP